MGFTICPMADVAAPVDSIWELLSEPMLYDLWWDARIQRVEPEGKAAPGQVLYAKISAVGMTRDQTFRVEAVYPEKHQIQLLVKLPLGVVNHATITGVPIDAASSRVQFG